MEEVFRNIRPNFAWEMENKIRDFADLQKSYKSMCYDDCVTNYNPTGVKNTLRKAFGVTEKLQKKKDKHCANAQLDCAKFSTAETKKVLQELVSLEKEIAELFDMYDMEQENMKREERTFVKGGSQKKRNNFGKRQFSRRK